MACLRTNFIFNFSRFNMEEFNRVGASAKSEWKKLAELPKKKFYLINGAHKSKGKFGVQVILDTPNFKVGLPNRFSKFTNKELLKLAGQQFCVSAKSGKSHVISFKEKNKKTKEEEEDEEMEDSEEEEVEEEEEEDDEEEKVDKK